MEQRVMPEPIEITIDQVERLYRSVTGREAPPVGDKPYAAFPPEKSPEQHVEEQMERLAKSLAQLASPVLVQRWMPALCVMEVGGALRICIDLPGVPKSALKVRLLHPGVLEVSGRRPEPWIENDAEDKLHQLRYREQAFGEFVRHIPVPVVPDSERIEARLRDGVLEILVPRHEESSDENHRIPVN